MPDRHRARRSSSCRWCRSWAISSASPSCTASRTGSGPRCTPRRCCSCCRAAWPPPPTNPPSSCCSAGGIPARRCSGCCSRWRCCCPCCSRPAAWWRSGSASTRSTSDWWCSSRGSSRCSWRRRSGSPASCAGPTPSAAPATARRRSWRCATSGSAPRPAAGAAAREGERQTRELLEILTHAPVLARGLDGRIRFWSDGAARLYGWSAERGDRRRRPRAAAHRVSGARARGRGVAAGARRMARGAHARRRATARSCRWRVTGSSTAIRPAGRTP